MRGVHCQRDSYYFLSLKSIVLALRRGVGGVKRQFLRYLLIESSLRVTTRILNTKIVERHIIRRGFNHGRFCQIIRMPIVFGLVYFSPFENHNFALNHIIVH